jgi:hypothetical protein
MPRIVKIGGWIAAVAAIVITVFFGPVVAAFAFVATAFAIMLLLIGLQMAHVIDVWRLDHPLRFHVPRRPVRRH